MIKVDNLSINLFIGYDIYHIKTRLGRNYEPKE